jgi:hypothetical protein
MKLINLKDLDMAIETLRSHGSAMVLVKNNNIICESSAAGIAPYVQAIQSLGNSSRGAALADKIVGRASALLSVYARIQSAYAETISEGAIKIFTQHNVTCRYGKKVPLILNRQMTDQCPFEHLVSDILNPEDAFLQLVQATRITK